MGSLVRICAVTAAALVALSFLMFAVDELGKGSDQQVRSVRGELAPARPALRVNEPAPPAQIERVREKRHSSVREVVDDANDVLVSPFTGIVDSDDSWVQRLVPLALALLLYGLGGLLLANALPKPHHEVRDWREPAA